MISEEKVRSIHDLESLLSFMGEELDWPLPQQPFFDLDEVTFEWTGKELSIAEDASSRLKDGIVRQLRPFRSDSPYGIFIVEFSTPHPSTSTLRQILRSLASKRRNNPSLPQWKPENLLFLCTASNNKFTFVHFQIRKDGKKPPKLITFGWEPDEPIRTLCEFNLPPLRYNPDWDDETWTKEWQSAFDVKKVTKKFYEGFEKVFEKLQEILYDQVHKIEGEGLVLEQSEGKAEEWAHDYALQFLSRLMFLYFIQKKKWLGENTRFVRHFWNSCKSSKEPKDTFFENWLSVLFFEAFNEKYQNRAEYQKRFPKDIGDALSKAPYLNGGLFRRNELDTHFPFYIPEDFFEILFEKFGETTPGFFEHYNFTISETTPLDQEVAVDPEMIGKVYESLVRGKSGIFYTPRVEIDLMCRLALVDYLANHLGENHKFLLYQAVFANDLEEKKEADKALADENLWTRLDELLRSITVLDPACGSGSFLVGMLLVLDDLLERAEKQLGKDETQYQRRKEIIANSLYGVDVMPWAVHIAELRLWLQLVVETELEWWEMKARPILPNLTFKVRPGDSLVQEVGGINFGLDQHSDIPRHLKGRLAQLKGERLKFYRGEDKSKSKEALEQEELNIFREILDAKAKDLEDKIKIRTRQIESPQPQISLAGMEPKVVQAPLEVERWKRERLEFKERLEQVQKVRKVLLTSKDIPFVWNIAFVEIFEGDKKGFDIVIGNPPYVRQEKISDPASVCNNATYKEKLRKSAYTAYQKFFGYHLAKSTAARKLNGRCDLLVFFYFQGLRLLNEKGSFCFITSNSWLDVGYGKELQEFLLKHCWVKMILDNEKKRSFAQSDVNTIIALFSHPDEESEWGLSKKARFVEFKVPFEEILDPVIFGEIEETERRLTRPEFRSIAISQKELYEEGLEQAEGKILPKYGSNKWGGKYLRAPEIFWTILEKGKGKLCKLDSLTLNIQRNNMQNLRNIMILPKETCINGYPFLHSLKDVSTIHVDISSLPKVISRKGNEGVKWMVPDIISNRFVGDRMCYLEGGDFLINDSFFIAKLKPDFKRQLVMALLNSTSSLLFMEILGRKTYGIGVMYIYGPELAGQVLLQPNVIPASRQQEIINVYERIAVRPLKSIFEELGLPKPNRDYSNICLEDVSLGKVLPDRREIDKVVFEVLGLSEEEQLAVYRAVVELVRNRLTKARSV